MSNAGQALHLRTLGNRPLWSRSISERNVANVKRCAWRNRDPIRHWVDRADITRCNTAPREPSALPDGEAFTSGVRSDDSARFVNHLALAACRAALRGPGNSWPRTQALRSLGAGSNTCAPLCLCLQGFSSISVDAAKYYDTSEVVINTLVTASNVAQIVVVRPCCRSLAWPWGG